MGANVFRMTCKHLAINHYKVFGKSDRSLIICLCFLTIIQGSSNLYNSIQLPAHTISFYFIAQILSLSSLLRSRLTT